MATKLYKKREKKVKIISVTIIAGLWVQTIVEYPNGKQFARFRLKEIGD